MIECSQGPKDKDAQALVHKITEADGNTESIIQGGNGAIRNRERRMQKPSPKGVPQGTFESSENLGRGLINQFRVQRNVNYTKKRSNNLSSHR